jgi:hypothetical protein
MSLRQVTVGVIGGGKVTDPLVCDALNEHFSFGPEDADGYFTKSQEFEVHLLIPVGARRYTEGIRSVWQWAVRTESLFLAVTDGTEFAAEDAIRETLMDPADWREEHTPELAILDVLLQSPNPMLLVITEDGEYTAFLRETAGQALARDIPVFDLSRALLEQGWDDLGVDPDSFGQPANTSLASGATEYLAFTSGQVEQISATLAVAYTLVTDLKRVAGGIGVLEPALATAERTLRQAQGVPALLQQEAPAKALQAAAADEADASGGEAAAGQPEAPAAEQPGSKVRMRTEVWDEDTEQWRPAGRGRPKAGARTRRVAR